jgi:hypothetical protein
MKQTSTAKVQFKDQLIEWSEKDLGVSFSTLNNVQQSRQMIKFFVLEILEKLYPGIVPDDEGELESSIIDGSGDGGGDFLYRTDDGQVLIIQAKYRGKDASESPEAVGRMCDLPERLYLCSQGKQTSLNKELIELAAQIDWAEDRFRLYFVSTGKSGQAVNDRVEQGLGPVPAFPDFLERSEFRYLDLSALNKELREALASADFSDKPIVIPMLPDANEVPWSHFIGPDREMYIGEVSGAELASLLQEHKSALFTMNIRDYVGDTKTNKQIKQTALECPEHFQYFNNGVTAVAGKITADSKLRTLTCEKLSVINGAQTIRSLLAAVLDKKPPTHKPVSSVRVILRLMSFSYPHEVTFVREVTKYNNTQNAIKIADFMSNDEVQKDLARRFHDLNLSGRRFEYLNKRSIKGRNNIAITLEELTKSIYAFEYGPDDMFGGASRLFDASPTGLYTKVFEHPDCPLTADGFNLIAGVYFACSYLKDNWEQQRKALRLKKETMHPSLERKGLIYFAVAELQRMSYMKQGFDLEHDLRKLAKPNDWWPDASSLPRVALDAAFSIASKVLVQQYDLKKKSLGFKHRNWFRDSNTLTDIRSGLEFPLDFGFPPRIWK